MATDTSFKQLLQPALIEAQHIVTQLSHESGGRDAATDPEVARMAIERWISDTNIMIDLSEALKKDGRLKAE